MGCIESKPQVEPANMKYYPPKASAPVQVTATGYYNTSQQQYPQHNENYFTPQQQYQQQQYYPQQQYPQQQYPQQQYPQQQ